MLKTGEPRSSARPLWAGFAALMLLSGCGGGETPSPAGLSRDEEQALNDAAAMLDATNNGTQSD